MPFRLKRVCSSAWLERTPDKGEVGGSSPPRPTIFPFKINTLERVSNSNTIFSYMNTYEHID